MSRIKPILHLLFLFFYLSETFGQSNQPYKPAKVLLPPPEAAALGKYGEIPVGHYTGVPDISIPIYSMNVGNFALPISLKYHASGIKVNEIASNVGLGWSLDAGGMISCTVNDLFDFTTNGIQDLDIGQSIRDGLKNGGFSPHLEGTNYTDQTDPYYDILKMVAENAWDGSPDNFNFSFAGRSGMFVFDENKTVRTVPYIPDTIGYNKLNNTFNIIDGAGTSYVFSELETSSVGALPGTDCGDLVNWFYNGASYTPVWHLKKITTATGQEINFFYEAYTYSYSTQGYQTENMPLSEASFPGIVNCAPTPRRTCNFNNEITGKRLIAIQSSLGHEVLFKYKNAARIDLTGSKALESIEIKNNGRLLNTYNFQYGYFGPGQTGLQPESYRLKLLSVQEQTSTPFIFEYNSTEMPSRNSYAQDYWGFYNGIPNNTLIPKTRVNGSTDDGADRRADAQSMKVGMLEKITYPTGGSTTFSYEPHDYRFTGAKRTYTPQNIGLQISSPDEKTVTFTTGNFSGGVGPVVPAKIDFISNLPYAPPPGDYLVGELIGPAIPSTNYFESFTTERHILLAPNSTYTLKLRTSMDYFTGSGGTSQQLNASITVSWLDYTDVNVDTNLIAGGLRIAKIVSDDNTTSAKVMKRFTYKDINNQNFSSGYRIHDPFNVYATNNVFYEYQGGTVRKTCRQFIKSSNSYTSQGAIKGTSVGYEYVTELNDDNGLEGKKVLKFKTITDIPWTFRTIISDYQIEYLSAPNVFLKPVSYDWLRGLPLEETIYKKTTTGYAPVSITTNTYKFADNIGCFLPCLNTSPNQKSVLGVKVVIADPEHQSISTSPVLTMAKFNVLPHYTLSDWFTLQKKTVTTFSQASQLDPIISEENYSFNNPTHAQLTLKSTPNSKNQLLKTRILYSYDYDTQNASFSSSKGIKSLKDRHIILPVEEISIRNINGQDYIVKGVITTYVENKPVPSKVYVYTPATLTPLGSFTTSTINSSGDFVMDPGYKEEYTFDYDMYSNVVYSNKKGDVVKSYLWDYNSAYPIAEAVNADPSQIAYTSFESNGTGNWSVNSGIRQTSIAMTGQKSYQLSDGAISKNGLNAATTYTLSYWTRNSTPFSIVGNQTLPIKGISTNGWTLFTHKLKGITEVVFPNTAGIIDEVSMYPADAQLTTFTYLPGTGISSLNKMNGNVSYYDYDNFQRLLSVRDVYGKILKQLDYKYQVTGQ